MFKQIKFDSTKPSYYVEQHAYYECCKCHEAITDKYKAEMLNGEKEYIRDHNGSTWNREFARLIVDYGIDIDYAKH